MKSKIHILLFAFSLIALIIGIFQFVKGETWEPILSLIYFLMFFVGGMVNFLKRKKE
jgi:hypothetical protein